MLNPQPAPVHIKTFELEKKTLKKFLTTLPCPPLQLPSDNLNRNEKNKKFVFLRVNFGGFHSEERTLMVSFHSGYIFIQTDKPIYNPGDTGET